MFNWMALYTEVGGVRMRWVNLLLTKSHERVPANVVVELQPFFFFLTESIFSYAHSRECPSGWVTPDGMTEPLCSRCF